MAELVAHACASCSYTALRGGRFAIAATGSRPRVAGFGGCLLGQFGSLGCSFVARRGRGEVWGVGKEGRPSLVCGAVGESGVPSEEVYEGVYGPWKVESEDVREVILYRAGLVTTAAAFAAAASTAFLPQDAALTAALKASYDILYGVGAAGLGVSLTLIHIYVTPIKRTLQLLWLVGVFGSLGLAFNFAAPADEGLVPFVLAHPAAVWGVGPLFASLTGLVFKEGLCYGKLEAAALFFVIPALLLGHLSGAMEENLELGLLGAWTSLFIVFAGRKFTQSIKDDIGDKSVFIFNALPQAQKEAVLSKLQSSSQDSRRD